MRQMVPFMLLLVPLAGGCGGSGGPSPVVVPGRALLQIFVEPNPIVAQRIAGDTYEFPFEIGIAERGGVAVEIQRVGIDVIGLGAIRLYSQTFGREEIARRGFPTSVPANGEIRYRFNPRNEVPDEGLFGGVSAELFAEGIDANGTAVRATQRVTVRR